MKRRVRGQSLVEMALLLPFLVMFTIGTMELGYYVYTYSELENATRRASEQAAKSPPINPANPNSASDACTQLAKQYAISNSFLSDLKTSNIVITYVPGATVRTPGNGQIQVQTTYSIKWLTPIGEKFFSKASNFSFTARRTIVSTKAPPGRDPVTCAKL